MNNDKIDIKWFVRNHIIMVAAIAIKAVPYEIIDEAVGEYIHKLPNDDPDKEDGCEIMQYWFISDDLARFMNESTHNNIVIDAPEYLDAPVWCRLCCNQAMIDDYEIVELFKTLEARYPNRYEALPA